MDLLKKASEFLKKYRIAALVLALGLILMLLPSGTQTEQASEPEETQSQEVPELAQELEQILSQIQGVGEVRVLLTEEAGERILYQSDQSGTATDTVIITDGSKAEEGLVQQVLPASYRGAIVVCQGADSPSVRLQVAEAVSAVTGLGTDRIQVLKMK